MGSQLLSCLTSTQTHCCDVCKTLETSEKDFWMAICSSKTCVCHSALKTLLKMWKPLVVLTTAELVSTPVHLKWAWVQRGFVCLFSLIWKQLKMGLLIKTTAVLKQLMQYLCYSHRFKSESLHFTHISIAWFKIHCGSGQLNCWYSKRLFQHQI